MLKDILCIRKPKIEIILIGFLSFFRLSIFNALISPFEIFAFLYFIYELLVSRKIYLKLSENYIYKKIVKLLILWSSAQLISDVINQPDIKSSLKGILTPLVILLSTRLILILYKRYNYKFFVQDFLIGFSLNFLYNLLSKNLSIEYSLKMGGLIALAIFFYSIFLNQNFHKFLTLILIFISFYYGVRSALIIFFACMLNDYLFKNYSSKIISHEIIGNVFKGFLKYIIILSILASITPVANTFNTFILNIYKNDNRFSELERQAKGGFFAARTEYFSFFDTFIDSPLIGHGSWAVDDDYKYSLISKRGDIKFKNKSNRFIIEKTIEQEKLLDSSGFPYIPSHSFIQQTVIWAGIFASFFFFYLININLFILRNLKLNYAFKLILIKFIWDTFFSPIGNHRFYFPILILILILSLNELKRSKS